MTNKTDLICLGCAKENSGTLRDGQIAECFIAKCSVCGNAELVTNPSYWAHPEKRTLAHMSKYEALKPKGVTNDTSKKAPRK